MGTEALHMSSSAHPTCSSLMASRTIPATQEVPLLEGNPRVRDTKKNLAKPSNMAKKKIKVICHEEYMRIKNTSLHPGD